MSFERPRGSEFTELVADHILGYLNRNVLPPVVDHKCHTDKFGNDRAGPCPSFDRFGFTALSLSLYFKKQLRVDVGTFLCAATHIKALRLMVGIFKCVVRDDYLYSFSWP